MTIKTNSFALIIGVGDYRDFDQSAGLPPGTSDLPGARRDAQTWFATCLALGLAPEHIRVLSSPQLSASDLQTDTGVTPEGVALGDATRASMLDGLNWLAGQLQTDRPVSGLLCFVGHGDPGEGGITALCPSDTTDAMTQVIETAALGSLAFEQVRANLTIMLDCCHAQSGARADKSVLGLLRAKVQGGSAPGAQTAQPRVLAACRRDQHSLMARFLGVEMGAFSWAVASTLGQSRSCSICWRRASMAGVCACAWSSRVMARCCWA